MIGYLNYIQDAPTLIISMSAICGALYGYLHRWSWSDCDMTLTKYLFGDMKMFFRVASVLAA